MDAYRRGLDLPAALEDGFHGLRVVRGSRSGWCVEYRPMTASGRCNSVAVYVDGIRADPGYFFGSHPVEDIAQAELLSATDATIRYGSTAGRGALVIETYMESIP